MNKELYKLANETDHEFCLRICGLKDAWDLSWQDIADIINGELGAQYSPDKYRKEYTKEIKTTTEQQLDELDEAILDFKKEKIKVQEERSQVNSLVRALAREETLKEIAKDAVEAMGSKKLLKSPKPLKSLYRNYNCGILAISDWHYGIDIDVYYNKYNPEIARERINTLLQETINIIDKEEIKEIFLINLGDMISGIIHLPLRINSRIDVITQTMEISEILAEFIHELTNHVVVNYGSVSDNHSRIDPNKKEALQPESFVRIIDWYLKERLYDNINVTFLENKFGADICDFDIFSYKVLAVHGDKDPQKSILTRLTTFTKEHYDLVLSAHRHHFYADESNETELFSNGSLMGTDDYASSLRLNNKPSQLFIVGDAENLTRAVYKIKL